MKEQGAAHTIESLRAGTATAACSEHILSVSSIHRIELFNKLAYERLMRKNGDIINIYNSVGNDWNETFYIMLFRVVGGVSNKRPFEELARRVTYRIIMRENSSIVSLEALLLGASGLLDLYPSDDYICRLRDEYKHLAAKYSIEALDCSSWRLTNIYPHNHPTLRIAQLASCLYNNTITIQHALNCRKRADVYRLFSGRASTYWVNTFMPRSNTMNITRRMGQFKSDLLGINLISQMQFAYGSYIQSDSTLDRAIALLEDIPAEDNRIIRMWNSHEKIAQSAYDSQALLQLSNEYCIPQRCDCCPLAARIMQTR